MIPDLVMVLKVLKVLKVLIVIRYSLIYVHAQYLPLLCYVTTDAQGEASPGQP